MPTLGKNIIFSWLNLCLLAKLLSFHGLNFFLLGYIFTFQQNFYTFLLNISTSWLNLYFLENILYFLAKPLPLGKTFISLWINLCLFAKLIFLLK